MGQVADVFAANEKMILVMAPEGTRSLAPFWKSGFLAIAEGAKVPILLAAIDFPRKRVELGPLLEYEGNPAVFMGQLREFYADKEGKHPDMKGPVTVREELEDSS